MNPHLYLYDTYRIPFVNDLPRSLFQGLRCIKVSQEGTVEASIKHDAPSHVAVYVLDAPRGVPIQLLQSIQPLDDEWSLQILGEGWLFGGQLVELDGATWGVGWRKQLTGDGGGYRLPAMDNEVVSLAADSAHLTGAQSAEIGWDVRGRDSVAVHVNFGDDVTAAAVFFDGYASSPGVAAAADRWGHLVAQDVSLTGSAWIQVDTRDLDRIWPGADITTGGDLVTFAMEGLTGSGDAASDTPAIDATKSYQGNFLYDKDVRGELVVAVFAPLGGSCGCGS